MQGSLDGENTAGARKSLAKAQKMLQLVSVKRHALALRDYHEVLDECIKPEASSSMKILGYRMASRAPTCTTNEIWAMLLEASVTELASSQNAPVLLYSIPILEQIPLPLVIGFLISSEKEPMNKLRAVLQHEQSEVRCCAIASLSKITLEAAVNVANDGLFAFPFESHESRIMCQQDLWTIITDVWRIIFQEILHEDRVDHDSDAVGAAFTAMSTLFGKISTTAPFNAIQHPSRAYHCVPAMSAANDLAASVYKEAFPRIRLLIQCAQRLPLKHQINAASWLSMLLYMMMERSGSTSPSLSAPYIEIDVVKSHPCVDEDDEFHATAERVRIDKYTCDILQSWLLPMLLGQKIPLCDGASISRAVFMLLSHPIQTFTRMQFAPALVQQLIAQCYYHKTTEVRLEMSHLLVRAFAWVSSNDFAGLFSRVAEAVHLMERETDRQELLQLMMKTVSSRVVNSRDFLLLESLVAMDIFRQPVGSSKLSPRTSGSHLYRGLVQSFLPQGQRHRTQVEFQIAQLIILKAFVQVILYKTNTSVFAHPQSDQETYDVMCYTALLIDHFGSMIRQPRLALKESLHFYQQDLQRAWKQIASSTVRLQLLWLGLQIHKIHRSIPILKLNELLAYEVTQSFSTKTDEYETGADGMTASPSSGVFDDGRLGGESAHGAIYGGTVSTTGHREEIDVAVAMVVTDILRTFNDIQPENRSAIELLHGSIRSFFSLHLSPMSLPTHVLSQSYLNAPTMTVLYAFEVFQPAVLFQNRRQKLRLESVPFEDNESLSQELITGSTDPLSMRVSYQQTVPGREDVVTLIITCCNTTSFAFCDFEVHIQPCGPVRCIDPSNSLKISPQQGGSGTLPPFGTLRAEKRFLVQRFSRAVFCFQVVYHEADSIGGVEESTVIRVAPATPYTLNFDALFRCPEQNFLTASFYRQVWLRTEDSTLYEFSTSHDSMRQLSRSQSILKTLTSRIGLVHELLVDLPTHSQLCYLTKTCWEEYIAVSITLCPTDLAGSSRFWSGLLEVRSSKTVVAEMARHSVDVLAIFCGPQARAVKTSGILASPDSTHARTASRTSSRTASRTVTSKSAPIPPTVVDPFAGDASFPTSGLPSASSKWDTGGGFATDAFGVDQIRPSEPSLAFDGGFGDSRATAPPSDPWGF